MTALSWIVLSSFVGAAASVLLAGIFAFTAREHWIPRLVSYAVGALLGAVFLEVLPHALEHGKPEGVSMTVLAGILIFFTLEKLVLWRHCHEEHCVAHETHQHDGGRSGAMIMVGDTFHNFVDGVLIAAAFLTDIQVGIVTSLAIIAHEIPQELGDFMILLHSGYSRMRALTLNLLSGCATLIGGLLGYYALQQVLAWVPYILALAAASMIYVAVADLIPGLHRRAALRATIEQVVMIACGIASIGLVGQLVHGHS